MVRSARDRIASIPFLSFFGFTKHFRRFSSKFVHITVQMILKYSFLTLLSTWNYWIIAKMQTILILEMTVPQICNNYSNLKFGVRAIPQKRTIEKRYKFKPLMCKRILYLYFSYLPFSISEDESLIATWGSIISYNSFLKCKLT